MSALTDAETRAVGTAGTAQPTAWRAGRPCKAECPICGLEYDLYPNGTLHRHGPQGAPCRGSQARVAEPDAAGATSPQVAQPASDWTQADHDAVQELYQAARALDPDTRHSTLYARAARSYYSRTGRLRAHGIVGYTIGCRDRVCREAMSDYQRGRYQGVGR